MVAKPSLHLHRRKQSPAGRNQRGGEVQIVRGRLAPPTPAQAQQAEGCEDKCGRFGRCGGGIKELHLGETGAAHIVVVEIWGIRSQNPAAIAFKELALVC